MITFVILYSKKHLDLRYSLMGHTFSRTRKSKGFRQLKEMVGFIIPSGRKEWCVFFVFLLFYLSFGLLFLFGTSLIDTKEYSYDMYFGFDNPLYFHKGGNPGCDSHPLFRYFIAPVIFIADMIGQMSYKFRGIFMLTFFASVVSLSNVYLFRYLKVVIKLKGIILYLLVGFFGCFSMNMILGFTPETYSIASCLLLFIAFYYSYLVIKNERVEFVTFLITSIVIGGSTITNYAKNAVYYLFSDRKWIVKILQVGTVGVFMLLIMFFSIKTTGESITQKLMWRTIYIENISEETTSSIIKITNSFLGAPILLPEIKQIQGFKFTYLNHSQYTCVWQYVWNIVLWVGLMLAIIYNRKNKLFLMILAVWGVDLLLHVVIGYGLREGIIYGGHWVYVVPIMLGWLYSKLKKPVQPVFTVILVVMFITMLLNNAFRLESLYEKATILFPPIPL